MAEIILTIVVEVVKCLVPPAYRRISYLRESKYTSNLQNLKTEVDNLKSQRVSTKHQVDEAERNGEEIEENVRSWLEGANKVIEEADKFTEVEAAANKRCFKGLCPNLKTRRRLSKEAVTLKEAIVKVRDARRFDRISYRTAAVDIRLIPNKDYEAFVSRAPILNDIMDALKNPNVNMLGIYGMGGIGKTKLAEEVARKVKSELFYQVVLVEVSRNQNIRKIQGDEVSHNKNIREIQGEIADKLGLKFHEESESGRANSLFKRIEAEKKILIILDNIWENLDLRVVGIPHGDGHKGCKVLLTARSLDVLSRKMDSRPNFSIGVLNEEEAWNLFKKMAGDYIEGSEFQSVARGVAKGCAGLPLSIVTVARALRNKSIHEWKDALEKLGRPSSSNFKDVQPDAYEAIKWSYDKLVGEELKNIFLLIGYTAIASIDELLMFGMGLTLFQGVNKMEAARNRVHTLVHQLKDSCLLLDHISQKKELFSMHDVVRDVAILIASTERNVFTATNEQVDGCREWLDGSAIKHCTSIVLHHIKTNLLPEVLECPQLELLFLRSDRRESYSLLMPNNFFERMIQVRVVNLTSMNLWSLPSSLGLLSNLRTLSLCDCSLRDISVVGDLKKLEILCLRSSYIEKLPVEVGELTWLKLLDLRDCWCLKVIPPNILSKLSHLEELYISHRSFAAWEVEVEGVKNASLEELKHLPNLTSLELHVYHVSTLPRGLLLEKLERYSIRIGDLENWGITSIPCREFRVKLNNKICLKDSLIVQLQRIEDLELCGLQEQDVDYFRNELVKVGSSHLKRLYMAGLGMWSSDLSLSSAESQRQEESANDLRSHEIILEDNVQISNTLFAEKVRLPELEELTLELINVERIWQNQVTVMSCGIQNLTHLTLCDCENLRCLFSSSTVSSLVRLQHIKIVQCPVLEELIVVDNEEEMKNNIVMFPQLRYLVMSDLEKFTSFCTGDLDILEFPSLKELVISGCAEFMARYKRTTNILTERDRLPELEVLTLYSINVERIWPSQVTVMSCGIQNLTHLTLSVCENLRCLFSSATVSSLVRLQRILIVRCRVLEELIVVDNQEEMKNNIVTFPQLQYLRMSDLEKFTSFCTGDLDNLEFPSLKELEISGCPEFMARCKRTTNILTERVFPNLEKLKVDAKRVVTNKYLFSEDLLCKLKYLYVELVDERTILSLGDFLQRLHTMKVLEIGGHGAWLPKEQVENGMRVEIREAKYQLEHILIEESSVTNNLVILHVKGCDRLVNLVPSSSSFQNLANLVVSCCEGLKIVLTPSIAKTLVRLRYMEIESCDKITEIVLVDGSVAKDEVITFRELKELKLLDLKSLTSFCSGNCAFKFPSLERLMLDGCLDMKIFSEGKLSTPKLHKVQGRGKACWAWKDDLNTTIRKYASFWSDDSGLEEDDDTEKEDGQGSDH
ncbi:hypothetical protein AB3S75_015167 [Citrus x aurantiifolia]